MFVRRSAAALSALCSVLLCGTSLAQDEQARAIAILKVQRVLGAGSVASLSPADVPGEPALVAGPASSDSKLVTYRVEAGFRLLPAAETSAVHVRLPTPRPESFAEVEALAYAASSPPGKTRPTEGQSAIAALVDRHAKAHDVPPALAQALVQVESSYNPKATGANGEIGLLQISPKTARAMGYKGNPKALYDPDTNLALGMKYLARAHDLADGDTCGTLLRYNSGLDARRRNTASNRFCAKVRTVMAKRA